MTLKILPSGFGGADRDVTAETLGQPLDDGQPHAAARNLAAVQALEHLEHAVGVAGLDARAVVLHVKAPAAGQARGPDPDWPDDRGRRT